MKITYENIEKILKTLPIGFYLKRGLAVRLDETIQRTYFDINKDEVVIALQNVKDAYKYVDEDKITDSDIEKTVRALLYHEMNKMMLTPKDLKLDAITRVFEDERLQTLTKRYYRNVNFKETLGRLMDIYKIQDDQEGRFYKLVRFRVGPQELVDKVHELIKKYKHLNINSTNYTKIRTGDRPWEYEYVHELDNYRKDVRALYDLCAIDKYFEERKEENVETEIPFEDLPYENENEENENEEQSNDEDSNENRQEQSEENEENQQEQSEKNEEDEQRKTSKKGNEEDNEEDAQQDDNEDETDENASKLDEDEDEDEDEDFDFELKCALETFKKAIEPKEYTEMLNALYPLIAHSKKQTAQSSANISSYSGQFNVRSLMQPNNDYKYFMQSNRTGNIKANSKVHLNLFIDVSGSFIMNESIVNLFLKALNTIEKQVDTFSFSVVTINTRLNILPDDNKYIKVYGGTWLNDATNEMRQVYKPDAANYTILMLDGDAFAGALRNSQKTIAASNFKVFNRSDTYIIADYSNRRYIEKHCKLATRIYTNQYASTFISTITNILTHIFR